MAPETDTMHSDPPALPGDAAAPKRPLRIAIAADELFGRVRGGGGQGRVITNLIRQLAALDHHNHYTLFAARPIREIPPALSELPPNFSWLQLPCRPREWLYFAWHLARRPLLERFAGPLDVVHATSTSAVPAVHRARLVVTVHDLVWWRYPKGLNWAGRFVHRSGLRIAVREGARLAAVSEFTRSEVLAYFGGRLPPDRVTVIPNGIDPDFGQTGAPSAAPPQERFGLTGPYLLTVGTVEPRKNLRRLVEAYGRLPESLRQDHPLVIVGPKGWKVDTADAAFTEPVPGRIVWTGYLADTDLRTLLEGASLFVYPSLYEGFGLPILEAMQCGIPVVTSRTAAMPEVAGNAALLIDPLDPADLAAAMIRVLTDTKLARCCAKRGFERATLFSITAISVEYFTLYLQARLSRAMEKLQSVHTSRVC